MTSPRPLRESDVSKLAGGLLALASLLWIAVMSATVPFLALVTGTVLLLVAAVGAVRGVSRILVLATVAVGVILLRLGVIRPFG